MVYSWKGHEYSMFDIHFDQLIYTKYETSSPGCADCRGFEDGPHDLRNELRAVGAASAPNYSNRVSIRVSEGDVYVCGEESGGRYIETVDSETGETVAHRILPPLRRGPDVQGTTGIDVNGVATVSVLNTGDDWERSSVILARVVSVNALTPGAERLTSHTAVLEPLMKLAGGADCSTKPRIKVRLWIDAKTSSIQKVPTVGSKVLAVVTHGYISGDDSKWCFWVGPDRYAFMPNSAALLRSAAQRIRRCRRQLPTFVNATRIMIHRPNQRRDEKYWPQTVVTGHRFPNASMLL